MMGKINDFISEKKILPKDCEYHTNRTILGKTLEDKGRIRVLVAKEDNIARIEYECPQCKNTGYKEEPWKRPFRTRCDKCQYSISVPKMKAQFKREKKMEK